MCTHTTITVAELIEQLERLPQDMMVFASDGSQYGNGILAHTGPCIVNTDIGPVVFIGNGDGELATMTGPELHHEFTPDVPPMESKCYICGQSAAKHTVKL